MENYKKRIIFLNLMFMTLFMASGKERSPIETGASVETGIHAVVPRTSGGINHDDRIKYDRFSWKGEGRFYGNWYASDQLTLFWDFLFTASTSGRRLSVFRGMNDETASFLPELKKFYGEFSLPGGGILGLGRQGFNGGETFLYSPSNYVDPTSGIESGESFWQIGTEWNVSDFTFGLTWIPSLIIAKGNESKEWYSHLQFLENNNRGGVFALKIGWFPYPFNINLFGYMKEQIAWEMDNFFLAAGVSLSCSILPELIIRGEAFVGNGFDQQFHFSKADAPLYGQWINLEGNRVYPQITAGLSWTVFNWLELSTEYFFNGTGMGNNRIKDLEDVLLNENIQVDFLSQTGAILDPLELGRHFILLRTRFDFPQKNLLFEPYIVISLLDGSFCQKGAIEWTASDYLTLTGGWLWYGAPKGGVFSLLPSRLTISLGAKYAF